MLLKEAFPPELLQRAKEAALDMAVQKVSRIREIEQEIRESGVPVKNRRPGFAFFHKVIGEALVRAQHHFIQMKWERLHRDMEVAERTLKNYKNKA